MHAATSTHKILLSARQDNRQSPNNRAKRLVFQSICAGVLAIGISGCTLSKTIDAPSLQSDLVTGSVSKTAKAEGVDPQDTQIINTLVGKSSKTPTSGKTLAWQNPDSGNSGTILAIEKFVGPQGHSCKKFQTTVDSFMGISVYDGETCELKKGIWILSRFFRQKLDS